jgi:hypothetical protein
MLGTATPAPADAGLNPNDTYRLIVQNTIKYFHICYGKKHFK